MGCNTDSINAVTWAPAMYKAMLSASASDAAVAWDAHWEGTKPNHHDKVTDWDLRNWPRSLASPRPCRISRHLRQNCDKLLTRVKIVKIFTRRLCTGQRTVMATACSA